MATDELLEVLHLSLQGGRGVAPGGDVLGQRVGAELGVVTQAPSAPWEDVPLLLFLLLLLLELL